jgi:hypothetical protein
MNLATDPRIASARIRGTEKCERGSAKAPSLVRSAATRVHGGKNGVGLSE